MIEDRKRIFKKVLPAGRIKTEFKDYILLWPEPYDPLEWMLDEQQRWLVVADMNLDAFIYKDASHFGFEYELVIDVHSVAIELGWALGPIFVTTGFESKMDNVEQDIQDIDEGQER